MGISSPKQTRNAISTNTATICKLENKHTYTHFVCLFDFVLTFHSDSSVDCLCQYCRVVIAPSFWKLALVNLWMTLILRIREHQKSKRFSKSSDPRKLSKWDLTAKNIGEKKRNSGAPKKVCSKRGWKESKDQAGAKARPKPRYSTRFTNSRSWPYNTYPTLQVEQTQAHPEKPGRLSPPVPLTT